MTPVPSSPPRRRADPVERAVLELAREVAGRLDASPTHLAVAVAAHRIAEIAERTARAEVRLAKEMDGVSWAGVGEAFGVNRTTAHERFRSGPDGAHTRSVRLREG